MALVLIKFYHLISNILNYKKMSTFLENYLCLPRRKFVKNYCSRQAPRMILFFITFFRFLDIVAGSRVKHCILSLLIMTLILKIFDYVHIEN